MIELLNMDCMDYLSDQPDNAFDLAIVDPPYGMKKSELIPGSDISSTGVKRKQRLLRIAETIADSFPSHEYYKQLKRVSRNQIVWGWNYLSKTPPGCSIWDWGSGRVVWNKNNPVLSGAEIAYQSFTNGVQVFDFQWSGFCKAGRRQDVIHPTQKPIELYEWLLSKYSSPGERVIDTHLGSGSSAIAAHYSGVDFVGIEIDQDYFKNASDRFKRETAQKDMFSGVA